MATENKSPSYLRERLLIRRWLLESREGRFATELLKRDSNLHPDGVTKHGDLSRILDDDNYVDWEDLYLEHKSSLVIASNCAEAREAASMQMQAKGSLGPPIGGPSKMMRFFSPPLWYHLRRQVETQNPEYWNDEVNVLREALANELWLCVPAHIVRGALEALLPKGKRVTLPSEAGESDHGGPS
jgi:hypothetical protein